MSAAGRLLLSLAVFATLTRLLDPADFGLMGLVYIYVTFVGLLADQGINAALIQRAQLEDAHIDTSFWFGLGCAVAICAATVVLSRPLSILLGDARLAPMLGWSSLSLVATAGSSTQQALFSRNMEFRRPALCTVLSQMAGGGVGIGMALAGFGVWSLIGQQLTASLVAMASLSLMSTYRPKLRFSLLHLWELLRFGGPLLIHWILGFFTSNLDQFVIFRFAGAPALGNYVIAGKLPNTINLVTLQPIVDVTAPALSQLQFDHERMCRAICRGMALNSAVMFAVLGGLAAISFDLVPFAFGAKWAAAAGICALLSVRSLLQSLQVLGYPTLLASGSPGTQLALGVANTLGGLVACAIGIHYGVPYLVAGLIINALIQLVLLTLVLKRLIGLSPFEYWKPCLAPASAALLMVLTIRMGTLIQPAALSPLLRMVCKIAIGAVTYIGFLYCFSRGTLLELERALRQTLRRSI
jgi:PST family polysaccharide transporter